VAAHASDLGLLPADVIDMVVTSEHVSEDSGVTHVYLRQRLRGIEVFGGEMNVNLRRDRSILSLDHSFVRDLAGAANTRVPVRDAVQAARSAARALRLEVTRPITVVRRARGPARETTLSDGGISTHAIPARLVYLPVDGKARLSWRLEIEEPGGLHAWSAVVDAETGDVLKTLDHVAETGAVARRARPAPMGGVS
jgi:extracellular elastinolytic metalloproteinase